MTKCHLGISQQDTVEGKPSYFNYRIMKDGSQFLQVGGDNWNSKGKKTCEWRQRKFKTWRSEKLWQSLTTSHKQNNAKKISDCLWRTPQHSHLLLLSMTSCGKELFWPDLVSCHFYLFAYIQLTNLEKERKSGCCASQNIGVLSTLV